MVVQNKDQIFQQLRLNQGTLASYGIHRFGIFGSFVRAEQNDKSDIDILVEFEPEKKSFDNFMNLAFFLEDLLGRKVDLITRESLSPYIGPKILAEVEYGLID